MGRKRVITDRDLFLIHRLVQDGSKIRAACRCVAHSRGWPEWKVKQFEETARKTYADRRDAGTLPEEDPIKSRYEEAIRAEFAKDEIRKQQARRALEDSLAKAEKLGLDIEDLAGRAEEIHQELTNLIGLLTYSPTELAQRLKNEGVTEEATVERYRKLEKRRSELEEQMALIAEYLRALYDLEQEGE